MTKILILAAGAIGAVGFAPKYRTKPAASYSSSHAPFDVLNSLSPAALVESRHSHRSMILQDSSEPKTNDPNIVDEAPQDASTEQFSPGEEVKVGNLVADEEWAGLSMELADVIRTAVVEDLKRNSREFLRKDNYSIGDFSKEIDRRVKEEVARMREKDDYELGDFSIVLDGKVKEMVCELTGKEEYEFGDLSLEIDKRVKESVARFCGKDTYEFGDLSKELAKRTKEGVLKYTGKKEYKFGDITKQAVKNFTGKDDYQFGDVTKKLLGNAEKVLGYVLGDQKKGN